MVGTGADGFSVPHPSQGLHPAPDGEGPQQALHLRASPAASLVRGGNLPLSAPPDSLHGSCGARWAPADSPRSCHRIAGDTALDKNIHQSVSEQIKKNFAKSKWKVSRGCRWGDVGVVGGGGAGGCPLCQMTDAVGLAASLQRHGGGETHAEAAAGNQPGGPWADNSHQPRRAAGGGHQQR